MSVFPRFYLYGLCAKEILTLVASFFYLKPKHSAIFRAHAIILDIILLSLMAPFMLFEKFKCSIHNTVKLSEADDKLIKVCQFW